MNSTTFALHCLARVTTILTAMVLSQTATQGATPANPPAKVDQQAKESDFNTITLTPKAEQRLNIKTEPVSIKAMPQRRTYGGEIIIPLRSGDSGTSGGNQSVFSLLPTMTPADRIQIAQAQVEADGTIAAARVQVEARTLEMERAQRMLKERSGSQRAVDDARAQLQLAQSELAKANSRRELLGPPVLYSETPKTVWVRVPVYAGDLARIARQQAAWVRSLSSGWQTETLPAKPVDAPPSANAAASSVDLFFTLANQAGLFQLGERIEVSLALKTEAEAKVVPWASVITDIYGGTWVYERTAEQQFVRQRVQVSRVEGDLAILANGPPAGSQIVTDGAAELFGTEVGFSK